MSAISKLSLELINLSEDLKVSYSGWSPSPTSFSSIQKDRNDVSQNSRSTPLLKDEIHHHHRKLSTWNNGTSYFEKLRSVAQNDRHNEGKPHLTTMNISTSPRDQLDDALENLIGSIQPCNTGDLDNMKNNKSQADILLSQLELLKETYINNGMNKSTQKEENIHERTDTFPIMTPHGNILFDFSKQSINYDIYIQLMQLVRLSNLDKFIQKIFHKSGEYHHIDYKEKRQNQLKKDQDNLSDPFVYRINSHSSVHNKDQLSNNNNLLISHGTDKTNRYISMAKAVHFRASSHCFVLDGIDISSRFQYDRNILRDTCLRFHNYSNTDSNIIQKENNDSPHTTSLSDHFGIDQMTYEHLGSAMFQLDGNTKGSIQFILVLCTQKMKKIYRLLESLLKSYISSNISILYITFDQISPFLTKYEQMSHETLQKDTSESFDFPNFHNISSPTMPFTNNILNTNTVLRQSMDLKEKNLDAKVKDENIPNSAAQKTSLNLSNEEFLLNYLRTSSLVLIFMKHLDEIYLTTFIRWYTEVVLNSALPLTSYWNTAIEHFWLVTSDYQRAETIFNIPKTNLFLWPTEHNDFDHLSIIISSILILPIALSVNYEIYSMFIDGISIVDKHCQETTYDRNVCIKMALLRIWSNICERKTTAIITCNDDLQYFGEYPQILLAEYDDIYQRKMLGTYTSIHGMPLAKMFLQQTLNEQNHFSYDLIAISGMLLKTNIEDKQSPSLTAHLSQDDNLPNRQLFLNPHESELLTISSELYEIEKTIQANTTSHPHTFILLDQFTPFTLGVLMGVYQMSIFFENIIRENIFQLNNQSSTSTKYQASSE